MHIVPSNSNRRSARDQRSYKEYLRELKGRARAEERTGVGQAPVCVYILPVTHCRFYSRHPAVCLTKAMTRQRFLEYLHQLGRNARIRARRSLCRRLQLEPRIRPLSPLRTTATWMKKIIRMFLSKDRKMYRVTVSNAAFASPSLSTSGMTLYLRNVDVLVEHESACTYPRVNFVMSCRVSCPM